MTDQDQSTPVTLSREQLYEVVWSTPLHRLATQYGITGTGLAKNCARLEVPCPPRGYWAKLAFNKPVKRTALPAAQPDTKLQVTIAPSSSSQPEKLSPAQTEAQQEFANALATHAKLAVPERLVRPHPIIAQWLTDHDRRKQEAMRDRDPLGRQMTKPRPFTEMDRRQHRLLDALFKALEPLGFSIKSDEYRRVHFEFQGERIEYQLREKLKQVRRPLTEDKKRWSFNSDRGWTQELQPTGLLIFTIKTWLNNGMRREWKDGSDNTIENALPEIVATLSLAGPYLVKQRQERLEAEKRRWEAERRRDAERQLREHDKARWQKLVEFARQRDEAASVRRLLAELKAKPQPESQIGGHPSEEWFAWADAWLEQYDPVLLGTEKILTSLVDVQAPFKTGY
jgi:hypothetical protein